MQYSVDHRFYYKLNYIDRIEFLWDHIKKGEVEVPDFVFDHDKELEHRPLMDYWIDSDPIHVYNNSSSGVRGTRESVNWVP